MSQSTTPMTAAYGAPPSPAGSMAPDGVRYIDASNGQYVQLAYQPQQAPPQQQQFVSQPPPQQQQQQQFAPQPQHQQQQFVPQPPQQQQQQFAPQPTQPQQQQQQQPYQPQPQPVYFMQPQVALAPQPQPNMPPPQQLPPGTVVYQAYNGYLPPGAIVLQQGPPDPQRFAMAAAPYDAPQPTMQAAPSMPQYQPQQTLPQQQQAFHSQQQPLYQQPQPQQQMRAPTGFPPPADGGAGWTPLPRPHQELALPQQQRYPSHPSKSVAAAAQPQEAPWSEAALKEAAPLLKRLTASIFYFCSNSTGPEFLYHRFGYQGLNALPPNFLTDFVQPKLAQLDDTRRNTWVFKVRGGVVELTKKSTVYLLELQPVLLSWLNAYRKYCEEEQEFSMSTSHGASARPTPVAAGLKKVMLRSQGESVLKPIRAWLGVEAPEVSMHMREPGATEEQEIRESRTSLPTETSRLCVLEWRFVCKPKPRAGTAISHHQAQEHRNEPTRATSDTVPELSALMTKYGPIDLPSTVSHVTSCRAASLVLSPKELYAAVAKSQLALRPGWGYVPGGAEPGLYVDHVTRQAFENPPDIRRLLQKFDVKSTPKREATEAASHAPSDEGDANGKHHDISGSDSSSSSSDEMTEGGGGTEGAAPEVEPAIFSF